MAELVTPSTAMKRATCPFLQNVYDTAITCESPFVGSNAAMYRFNSRGAINKQLTLFCACNYKCCENYRMVMSAKYPDDEEDEHGQI